ncbi:MAG: efflux RND transporter periplasmic adaptor subunit [Desulfobacterales bacterium]|nr:MAG: efflux RND transporter periplasmic adaptor subunit [Desulfobacterales bacterium]
MKSGITLFTVILTVLLAAFAMTGCKDRDSMANTETNSLESPAVPVSVVVVNPIPMKDVIYLPGETEAWQDVQVAANTAGRIEWIGPREGQNVKKGALLAKIDVSALKAALDHAEAAHQLAEDLYQRRHRLYENKIIAKEELDQSETQRKLTLTDLEQIKVKYNHGFPKSPITGIINHLYVDVGEYADVGKPIADIVNIDKIKINVRVPELDVRYVKKGQKTPIKIDAFPDRTLIGTVDFVAFKADPATKTFLVRSVIDNPDHDIRPGMIGRVVFVRRIIPDAIAAPLFALVDKGGERIVFVEKNGVAESRTISIGVIEGDRIQITSGLDAGDHLIVKGHTEVEDGMKVTAQ